MKLLVGVGHLNYLASSGIAIVVCSLANFLLSEEWVFAREEESKNHCGKLAGWRRQ